MSITILYGDIKKLNIDTAVEHNTLCLNNSKYIKDKSDKKAVKSVLSDIKDVNKGGAILVNDKKIKAKNTLRPVEALNFSSANKNDSSLYVLYQEILNVAIQMGSNNIAIPVIRTKNEKTSIENSILTGLSVFEDYIRKSGTDMDIYFVLPNYNTVRKYKSLFLNGAIEDRLVYLINDDGTIGSSINIHDEMNKTFLKKKLKAMQLTEDKLFSILTKTIIGLSLLILILGKIFPIVRVSGRSMYPTFNDGNVLLLKKDLSEIHRNDIVIFDLSRHFDDDERIKKEKNKFMIKRVVGLPGDSLTCTDGYLYVNGTKEHQDFNVPLENEGILIRTITLKSGQYFVMGDNRNNSFDSRYYGYITREDMYGIYKCRLIGNIFK